MPNSLSRFLGIALFAFFLHASPAGAGEQKLYIKDGDSFVLGRQEIRLWGIDAVELHQFCDKSGEEYPCGRQAREFLVRLIDDPAKLECEEKPRSGKETRTVARCFIEGEDVAGLMVQSGWAIDYSYFSHGFYKKAEDEARATGKGLWAGTFQTPREWRKNNKY